MSLYNHYDLDEKTLFKNADRALYSAKEKGRNNYQIYTKQETG
ncbi:hypothetical protein [Neobacillus niacini]